MKLRLGPIVGAVSHREARLWLRADDPAGARVHVFRDGGAEVPGSPFAPVLDPSDTSGTATVVARLPAPYTRYRYDVRDAAGASALPGWLGAPVFWSAPAPDTAGPFRFGVVSCNDMRDAAHKGEGAAERERPWRTLFETAHALDFAFLLCVGDQVYADDVWRAEVTGQVFPPTLRRAYAAAYQAQWDFRWLRRTLADFPTYMTWDDHEIRNGWGSVAYDASQKRQAAFAVAREAYRRFQHDHNPPSFAGPDDLFYAFRYGNAGVLVLDGRGARDITRTEDPLLGARQWQHVTRWLEEETAGLGALFVVASVPPVHVPPELAKPGGALASDIRDQWTSRSNAPELARLAVALLDCANRHDIPVVLLSGDVHLGTVACIRSARPEHGKRPLLYQLCSSPLTNRAPRLLARVIEKISQQEFAIAPDIDAYLLAGPLAARNFGVVEAVHEPDRYRLTLKLFDDTGAERIVFPLPG